VDAASIRDAIHPETAYPRGTAVGAWLHRIRFKPAECARRPVFRLELDERTEDMRPVWIMRLSEEACVHTRPLEAGLLEDRGHLLFVWIDQGWAEDRDELVEVHRCLTRLNGIRLGSRCIRGREESLRERGWSRLIATAARD